jgi:hypothetical protein
MKKINWWEYDPWHHIYNTSFSFVTYEWAQQVRVLHKTRLERLARDKDSSLLVPFVSYEENKLI